MKKIDFYECMQIQEKQKRDAGTDSTADLYKAVKNRLVIYYAKEKLALQDISAQLVAGFKESLIKEGLRVNTVNSYISCLRAMYNRGCREAKLKQTTNPFSGIRIKREETKKRAIPIEIIEKIACWDLSKNQDLKQSVDLALFCFMACGMPFTDLVHLTKENIQDDGRLLVYRRQKTGVLIQIGINTGMCQLIEEYSRPDTKYLFPILPENANHGTYKALLAAHNRQLKEIGKQLELPAPLTSYVFRHTWASEAYRRHVEISVISQALGHSTEKMTRNYLAQLDPEEIIKANKIVSNRVEMLMGKREVSYL